MTESPDNRTTDTPMPAKLKYRKLYIRTLKLRVLDYLRFDSLCFSFIVSSLYAIRIFLLMYLSRSNRHLLLAGELFRRTRIRVFRSLSTAVLNAEIKKKSAATVGNYFRKCASISNEELLVSKRLIMLSEPLGASKGVLILAFNHFFRYFAYHYDLERLGQKYVVILEPSFNGLYQSDICSLLHENLHLLIQTLEPVDERFVRALRAPVHPVELSSNMWVDPGLFKPIDGCEKKFDFVMVALWADYKRHYHLFSAMAKARNKIRVALIGGPWPHGLDCICQLAEMYGVRKQVSCFENLTHEDLNRIINESRFHILLSKKEGSNRAIIESLFAGTPIVLLKGWNFGHHYFFVNACTGLYVDPRKVDCFIDALPSIDYSRFTAADWARKRISPAIATEKVKAALAEMETRFGIAINKELAIKVNNPEMEYISQQDRIRLEPKIQDLDRYLR